MHAHREDHRRDAGDCLFRSRKYCYIWKGRSVAEEVVKSCSLCKARSEDLLKQRMAELPKQVFDIPCSPFTHVCLDFMGPVEVKSMTNKRSYMKCWPLLFICLNTSAVHIQLSAGYSTEDLILELKGFFAIRGVPKYMVSDPGSQMVAAKKLIEASKHTPQQQLKFDLKEASQVAFRVFFTR